MSKRCKKSWILLLPKKHELYIFIGKQTLRVTIICMYLNINKSIEAFKINRSFVTYNNNLMKLDI